MEALNQQIFLAINAAADTPSWLLALAGVLAKDVVFLLPLLLAGLWLWGGAARRSLALQAALVTVASLVVNQLIGMAWFHPRPEALNLGHAFISHAHDASFPSDHTAVFASAGFALLKKETRFIGWLVLVAGIFVGAARVFLGVHFPFDIIGAFVISGAVCYAAAPLWSRIGQKSVAWLTPVYKAIFAPLIAKGWVNP